jgi:hypothetical protein
MPSFAWIIDAPDDNPGRAGTERLQQKSRQRKSTFHFLPGGSGRWCGVAAAEMLTHGIGQAHSITVGPSGFQESAKASTASFTRPATTGRQSNDDLPRH